MDIDRVGHELPKLPDRWPALEAEQVFGIGYLYDYWTLNAQISKRHHGCSAQEELPEPQPKRETRQRG